MNLCLKISGGRGVRVYSQFEEDGILLYLDAVLGIEKKIFLDIGAADGINRNCANLALNLGYTGVLIDGNKSAIELDKFEAIKAWFYVTSD